MNLDRVVSFYLAQSIAVGSQGIKLIRACFKNEKELFLASKDEIITRIKTFRFEWYDKTIIIEEKDKKTRFFSNQIIEKMLDINEKKDIVAEYERVLQKNIYFYKNSDDDFPDVLRHIPHPPEQLFVIGSLPDPDRVSVGIVGARDCTAYGRDMARMFAYRLAKAGVNIISGMAKGIDGWSHRGALDAKGKTYAILGSGVEVCYPTTHGRLYNDICNTGGVISEFPTTYPPLPTNFPLRNRIISGLSDGILVVEARIRSGSLITADAALDQGKDVFVIPGRIGDGLSEGCNRLIRQGAIPVISPNDILEYYGIEEATDNGVKLPRDEQQLYDLIGSIPKSLSELSAASQGTLANTIRILTLLKKNGYIRETSKDRYIRV